ncbi:hypothetical protein BO94DRAFT_539751, partial [Aspergillus sclerotioniger CBS 115572]
MWWTRCRGWWGGTLYCCAVIHPSANYIHNSRSTFLRSDLTQPFPSNYPKTSSSPTIPPGKHGGIKTPKPTITPHQTRHPILPDHCQGQPLGGLLGRWPPANCTIQQKTGILSHYAQLRIPYKLAT